MALRSKPAQADIEEVIRRGGSTAAQPEPKADKTLQLVQLRLPKDLTGQIDAVRSKKIVPPSRHAWILEAILEKLRGEQA